MIRLGVIADPQYADVDDGAQFGSPERIRYYRGSLDILSEAFKTFHEQGTAHNIILGDILDGKAKTKNDRHECMQRILNTIEKHIGGNEYSDKVTFVCGNHDFFNFSREELFHHLKYFVPQQFKKVCSPERLYHCQEVSNDIACIYLDTYEVSIDGGVGASSNQAKDIIRSNNPNWGNNNDWLAGLSEEKKRYVPYNGGMTDGQLLWLKGTLEHCKHKGQNVLVFVHAALTSGSCRSSAISWSADQALVLLQNSGIVIAVLSGHDHDGGMFVDETGIRHITPPAPLEAPPGTSAYGILHLDISNRTEHEKLVRARFDWQGGSYYPRPLRDKLKEGYALSKEDEEEKAFWDGEWWYRSRK